MTPGSVPSGPTINTNIQDVNRYLLRDRSGGEDGGHSVQDGTVDLGLAVNLTASKPLPSREPACRSFVLRSSALTLIIDFFFFSLFVFFFFIYFFNDFTVFQSGATSLLFFSFLLPYCLVSLSCLCCVADIGVGSSPTSSQMEALPPSTDWPVSAYTSSFSLSSPETDDPGTQFDPYSHHNDHLVKTAAALLLCFSVVLLLQ